MQTVATQHQSSSQPILLRLGTRTSQLALWQTNYVAAQLQQQWPQITCQLVHLVTQGDKRLDRPLPEIGGKGLFTAELEEALRGHEIDMAVHSLKDLPVEDPAELMIGAILHREDTRDVLVARQPWTLATLPQGAIVGTSSLRRQAQLLAARPDLVVRSIRGNVDTRLRKVMDGEYDAAVMAGAGLSRLGLTQYITQWLPETTMVPAPGQGALAVQCRREDGRVREFLAAVHDAAAATTAAVERQLLQRLGGGCSAPIGASATLDAGAMVLHARVVSVDGRHVFDVASTGEMPDVVAQNAVDELIAQGATTVLGSVPTADMDGTQRLPLYGKRVVITRPHSEEVRDGQGFAAQLRALGAVPIHIPAIALAPIQDRTSIDALLATFASYDWIIYTSAAAVEYLWGEARPAPAHHSGKTRVAAVGPSTRAALEARGIMVDAMPTTYRGIALADALGDLAGKRVLLPRSLHGSPDLPNALREAGAHVDIVPLYAPVDVTLDEGARALLARGVDVVTFASSSAVRAFVAALKDDPRFDNFWARTLVAAIGPSTAATAREAGLSVEVTAHEYTMAGLLAALVKRLATQEEPSDLESENR